MKKLAAIFFFALFLFNTAGYRLMFFYLQKESDSKLEASLDKNLYNESELVTLKIPLCLPYINNQTAFERVDGEINFNGKIYKYVKRKIAEGSLVLLCLPDYNKMRLKKEKEDFYKDSNDIAQNTNSKKQENSKSNSFKNVFSEYDQLHYKYIIAFFDKHISYAFSNYQASLPVAPHSSPEQPPELL